MEETKICPHCGKEILVTAKKCKFCGEWLEKKCPCCQEWIAINAKKCRYCGTWLNKYTREKYEGTPVIPQETPTPTKDKDDEDGTSIFLWLELGAIVGIVAMALHWSWWVILIVVAIGVALLRITVIRFLYGIAISIVWALVGYFLTPILLNESDSQIALRIINEDYTAYYLGAAICGIVSLWLHWSSIRSN